MAGNRYHAYRRHLKPRARAMRTDGTSVERELWYEFLSALPQKFTRQKPLGPYIADFYCSRYRLVVDIRVVRFTNPEVMQEFEAVCAAVLSALGES